MPGSGNDYIYLENKGLAAGFGGDDVFDLVKDGTWRTNQIHAYGADGDDTFILDVSVGNEHDPLASHGHHVFMGNGFDSVVFKIDDTQGTGRIVGRIDDLDIWRDKIFIERAGVREEVDLMNPPDSVRIVIHKEQQYILIDDHILYALEGARIRSGDVHPDDWMGNGEEVHFISWPEEWATGVPSSADVEYMPQLNYVPLSQFDENLPVVDVPSQVDDGQGGTTKHVEWSGTEAGEFITSRATRADNVLFGLGGDDIIEAGKGWDVVYGGEGNDSLAGGVDNDILYGGNGADLVYGGTQHDEVYGDAGADVLHGASGSDEMYGGLDRDKMYGGRGNDTMQGGDDYDRMMGGDGADVMMGGDGRDQMFGGGGDDRMQGDFGNDLLRGHAGDDFLQGDGGSDTLEGQSGADEMYGGASSDVLYGHVGQDILYGDTGSDKLYGGAWSDVLFGGTGSDQLYGGQSNDYLYGGDQADALRGGTGRDRMYGGGGSDDLRGQDGNDLLSGGEGNDKLYGGSGSDEIYGGSGADTFVFFAGDDWARGGTGDDTFIHRGDKGTLTIDDFGVGADVIDLRTWNVSQNELSVEQVGADLVLSHEDKTVVLEDTTTLDMSDVWL